MMRRSLACTLLALGMLLSATAYSSGVDTYQFRCARAIKLITKS